MPPDALTHLVARAEAGGLVLTSLMAKLRCKSFAERMFVPAFIFFFQMLYPFAWANNPRRATAAAAGGCMLVRREALQQAGGIAAIRNALIDDCALAKLLKRQGPISIALTDRVHSIRAYPAIADIRRMVSRSAYAQLNYSPLLLAGTVVGLALTYLAPVALALFAGGVPQFIGLFTWLLMAFAFRRTLRFYGLSIAVGAGAAGDCGDVYGLHRRFRLSACARARRHVERPRQRSSQYFGSCDERRQCDCGRARGIGMRISRWRRSLFIRAIAARSWRSTISSAPPTTSPIMRRCRRTRSCVCSTGSKPA